MARSTGRLRDHLLDAVIRSGGDISVTAVGYAESWWMVRAAVNEAAIINLPIVDELAPRMFGNEEIRFRPVRDLQNPESKTWTRHEPWMNTLV